MSTRLCREEIVTIGVLSEKGQNHCEIARALGVTEARCAITSSGRQRVRRIVVWSVAEAVAEVIRSWFADRSEQRRPVNEGFG